MVTSPVSRLVDYDQLIDVIRRRRSVRRFEKGKTVPRDTLLRIAEAGRYRRPLEQLVHWNGYQQRQYRPDEMLRYYVEDLRPFAMYRGHESLLDWDDADEKLGPWKAAFTGPAPGER